MSLRTCDHRTQPDRQSHAPPEGGRIEGASLDLLSRALYWAVSTGMWDAMENETPAEKETRAGFE
jgi:hypothetical protein